MTKDALPPHNKQAEWMLISCATDMPSIVQSLHVDLFYLAETRAIFDVLTTLRSEGSEICQHSVGMRLKPDLCEKFSIALKDLASPSSWNYWLNECEKFAQARESLRIAAEISEEAMGVSTGGRLEITAHIRKLQAVGRNSTSHSRQLREILPEVMDKLEAVFTNPESLYGVRTGFPTLDLMTMGFHPGQFWVVGARPSIGKTALACTIGNRASAAGVPVGFFSLEMPGHEIGARFLAIESAVELNKARNGKLEQHDFDEWSRANARLVKRTMFIIDDAQDIEDICRIASKLVMENGVKLLIVDYLQLIQMRRSNEGRYTTVGMISNALKSFALLNRVAVLALAQLNRACQIEDRIPNLSDLRDSGCIEQDADIICLLHRKETQTADTVQIPVQIYLAKNRNGEVGNIPMIFRNRSTTFEEAP